MRILGIETSCDETAAAVVENGTKILSNVVASSVGLHKKTGGIIPEIAAREQVKYIIPVVKEAIAQASNKKENKKLQVTSYKLQVNFIDAIAVTVGPGLIGSLLVGVETAKTLSYLWQKPVIPVNHLLAHIYANWLNKEKLPEFPAVALIASGGHTELVLMRDHGKFTWLGGTRDDAAGEAFDKIARLLNLGFPGGPAIERTAKNGNQKALKLPRPMITQENFDFSFSGLKTAVLRLFKPKDRTLHPAIAGHNIRLANLSASVQEAIVDCLTQKTIKAAQKYKAKSILLSGGVAANNRLREKMKLQDTRLDKLAHRARRASYKLQVKFFAPAKNLCTDNASPIASYAFFNFRPVPWQKINSFPSLEINEQPF